MAAVAVPSDTVRLRSAAMAVTEAMELSALPGLMTVAVNTQANKPRLSGLVIAQSLASPGETVDLADLTKNVAVAVMLLQDVEVSLAILVADVVAHKAALDIRRLAVAVEAVAADAVVVEASA